MDQNALKRKFRGEAPANGTPATPAKKKGPAPGKKAAKKETPAPPPPQEEDVQENPEQDPK